MSLDSHLIHTCVIENPASGSTNVYNNAKKAYEQPITDVRCRLIEDRETIISTETQQSVIRTVYTLIVLSHVNISERAQISLVTLEDGTQLIDKFVVNELLTRRGRNSHHKTAVLERIS